MGGCCQSTLFNVESRPNEGKKPSVKPTAKPVVDKSANGLTHVGEAVYQALRTKHAKHHHTMWNVTKTAMVGSLQQTPTVDVFTSPAASDAIQNETHSNWFAENMSSLIGKTTKWCDVMSLAAPDGFFREQFKIALATVAKNAVGKEDPVVIRLMFGNIIGLPINCERVMNKLTADLPDDANVQLWVGAWRYAASWNHTKLIAVDGKYLHTGGHNLWSDIYLKKDPVHDLSIQMEGDAALDAHVYANEQWQFIEKKQGTLFGQMMENVPDFLPLVAKSRVIISEYPKGKAKEFAPYFDRSMVEEYETPSGAVPVITVGRQGAIVKDDRPADDAFVAMIDSGKHIIHMSLQDLGPVSLPGKIPLPGTGWPKTYFDAMARAIWQRGVDIEIILSNPGTRRGYTNGWSADDVGAEIIKRIQKQFPEATDNELRQKVEDNLRICYIRHKNGNTYANGEEVSNHAKFFIVDDVCSYTGSQNLYIADLAEWGVVIDDEDVTAKMMEDYWTPLWEASWNAGDCEVQDVMDGLKVDRDGEVIDTYSTNGKKAREKAAIAMAKAQLPLDTDDYDESDIDE